LTKQTSTPDEAFGRFYAKQDGALRSLAVFGKWRHALIDKARPDDEHQPIEITHGTVSLGQATEINAAELRRTAGEDTALSYLPLLGCVGYFVKRWSHVLAGYPKTGKSETVFESAVDWSDERVLWLTEEPESVWQARLGRFDPDRLGHITLVFALGLTYEQLAQRIAEGTETVVVVDTTRNLLGLRDESDNAEVARVCGHLVALCRRKDQTLVLLHHTRKQDGEHGKAIAGAGAFLGVVNVGLELMHDGTAKNRRRLRGWAHVIEIEDLITERREGGSIVAVGSPGDVSLAVVQERIRAVLSSEWRTTKQVHDLLDDPRPSLDQVTRALKELATSLTSDIKTPSSEVRFEGPEIERDPPISEAASGKRVRWRLLVVTVSEATSDDRGSIGGGEVANA
jgi:hypothetical protein